MAIADGRTTNKPLVDLMDRKFISPVDKTKDSLPNTTKPFSPLAESSKLAAAIGKKNVFETLPPKDPGANLTAISAFPNDGNPSCVSNNTNGTKAQDDRKLLAPNNNDPCPSSPDTGLVHESILKHMTTGLPESKIVAIEKMLNSQITAQVRASPVLSVIDKQGTVLKGVSSVSKALSEVGKPLKEKTHLMSLLGCMQKSGANADESNLIKNIVIGGLLAQALCMSVNKMLSTIQDIANLGVTVTGDLIANVVDAFHGSRLQDAADKVAILSKIPTLTANPTPSDIAKTLNSAETFMKSLASSKPNGSNNAQEHKDTLAAFAVMDPSWNQDASGNPNVCKLKGNGYVESLTISSLTSKAIPVGSITTKPTPLAKTDPKYTDLLILAANSSKKQLTDPSQLQPKGYGA